ncbi:hypothetical protein EDB82DRAFT_517191 [Fusarium venenatum]|uniref:uncharacterized protein n=1 Tax=Fusarium venenatum TaxID=56646 RepID=UPI001E154F93|nr:hypothetical protein EDB82DRAFT_517191 [Fusarium venenatum]
MIAEAYITNVKRPRLFIFIFTMYIGCWRTFSGTPFLSTPHCLSFATKIPGVHRGSICNIFVIYYIIHPLASTVASGYCMLFMG